MTKRYVTRAERRARQVALHEGWTVGYSAGWTDGVNDATEDEPPPRKVNPYPIGEEEEDDA